MISQLSYCIVFHFKTKSGARSWGREADSAAAGDQGRPVHVIKNRQSEQLLSARARDLRSRARMKAEPNEPCALTLRDQDLRFDYSFLFRSGILRLALIEG